MWKMAENLLNAVGRKLEYWVTGQSGFQIRTGDLTGGSTVNNETQAKLLLDDVRRELVQKFRIQLRWPVMLQLQRPPGVGWKATFYNPEGNLGRYTAYLLGSTPAHQIQIRPALPRARFRALLAHELIHAYQREANILPSNQALREGMARWAEYHFLLGSSPLEAKRLLRIRHYTFGKAIHTILDYEKSHGTPETVRWLHESERTH
jgi:hypothetical protein